MRILESAAKHGKLPYCRLYEKHFPSGEADGFIDLGQGALLAVGLCSRSEPQNFPVQTRGLMKKLIMTLALVLATGTAYGYECKVCHSKNPAMVRMHKALQGRNCFDCHKMGEKLMGKGIPKDKAAQIKRRESEQICFECHKK
jgi:hypothetical protein